MRSTNHVAVDSFWKYVATKVEEVEYTSFFFMACYTTSLLNKKRFPRGGGGFVTAAVRSFHRLDNRSAHRTRSSDEGIATAWDQLATSVGFCTTEELESPSTVCRKLWPRFSVLEDEGKEALAGCDDSALYTLDASTTRNRTELLGFVQRSLYNGIGALRAF